MKGRGLADKSRAEARAWVGRLTDAHNAADRARFEEWLAADPEHGRAYEEIRGAYDASSVLRASALARGRDLDRVFGPRSSGLRRGAVLASLVVAVAAVFSFGGGMSLLRPVAIESVMLTTSLVPQDVILADGTKVHLSPASKVRIDLGRSRRLAEIREGHAILEIAREKRVFLIVAGQTRLEATSGSFVAEASKGAGSIEPRDKPQTRTSAADLPESGGALPLARATLEFNAEPLGNAVARINAAEAGPQLLIDPTLQGLKVTGVFQHESSEALARSLALAFNLKVRSTEDGTLQLTR